MPKERKIGEIKCPSEQGAYNWLLEFCKALEEKGYECVGDKARSIATPMKEIGQIHPKFYEKPITIKQWLNITNYAALGLTRKEPRENVLHVEVLFQDKSPYQSAYEAATLDELKPEHREQIKQEVKKFINDVMQGRKLPKHAQCEVVI